MCYFFIILNLNINIIEYGIRLIINIHYDKYITIQNITLRH